MDQDNEVSLVTVQPTTDPNMRVYNVRHELTEAEAEDGCRGSKNAVGAFGNLILEIRGVELVRVQPYRFFISKAVNFEWVEVEAAVVEVMRCWRAMRLLTEDYSDLIGKAGAGA